jgi:hypothetical protein
MNKRPFFVFSLEAHPADGLLEVLREGVRPWWQQTREVAVECREARVIEFGEPPEGFRRDGGWWEDASGDIWPLPAQPEGLWTRAMTETLLGPVDEMVNVVLPSGVSSISGDAFRDYSALRSLIVQSGCVEIMDGKLDGVERRDGSWELIHDGAMADCISLVRVALPGTCTSFGKMAFRGCSNLLQLTVFVSVAASQVSSVGSIGDWAFYECSCLANVTIPSSVTSIGRRAFDQCSALTHLSIGSNVKSIGAWAFRDCSGLTELTIPSGVTNIGKGAFYFCSALLRLTFGSSVTTIGALAFGGCSRLTELTIPSSVRSIGQGAFDSCSGLRQLTMHANVSQMGGPRGAVVHGATTLAWRPPNWRPHDVFKGVRTLECVTLFGCPLDQAVVTAVEPALAQGAKVVGPALAGQNFGRFVIVAAP